VYSSSISTSRPRTDSASGVQHWHHAADHRRELAEAELREFFRFHRRVGGIEVDGRDLQRIDEGSTGAGDVATSLRARGDRDGEGEYREADLMDLHMFGTPEMIWLTRRTARGIR
jgi:hypothetical protein